MFASTSSCTSDHSVNVLKCTRDIHKPDSGKGHEDNAVPLLEKLVGATVEFSKATINRSLDDLLSMAKNNLAAEDPNIVCISAKLLALIHAQGEPLKSANDKKAAQRVIEYLRQKAKSLKDAADKSMIRMLLDACEGKFDFKGKKLTASRIWDANDSFHILGALAIRKHQLDALKELCTDLAPPGDNFYSHHLYPMHSAMMELLDEIPKAQVANKLKPKKKAEAEVTATCEEENQGNEAIVEQESNVEETIVFRQQKIICDPNSEAARLLAIFMEQLYNQKAIPTAEDFRVYIRPAIRKYEGWRMFTSKMMPDNRCEICYEPTDLLEPARHTYLPPARQLTPEEYACLKEGLKKSLFKQPGSETNAFKIEYQRLQQQIDDMNGHRGTEYWKENGYQMLVFNGMDPLLMRQMPESQKRFLPEEKAGLWSFKSIHRFLVTTMLQKYSPVLAIFKPGQVEEHIEKLEYLNVRPFIFSGSTDPDLFVLNAALMVGPKAHLFSNHSYLDNHLARELLKPKTKELLEVWCRSNQIKFSNKFNTYEMPSNCSNAIVKDDYGYHIILSRLFRYGRWGANNGRVKCIRSAQLPGTSKERSRKRREAKEKEARMKERESKKKD